jgi:hypothetical protein
MPSNMQLESEHQKAGDRLNYVTVHLRGKELLSRVIEQWLSFLYLGPILLHRYATIG